MYTIRAETIQNLIYTVSMSDDSFIEFTLKHSQKDKTLRLWHGVLDEFNAQFHVEFTVEQFSEAVNLLSPKDFILIISLMQKDRKMDAQSSQLLNIRISKMYGELLKTIEGLNNDEQIGYSLYQVDDTAILISMSRGFGEVDYYGFTLTFLNFFFDDYRHSYTIDVFSQFSKNVTFDKLHHFFVDKDFEYNSESIKHSLKIYTRRNKLSLLSF